MTSTTRKRQSRGDDNKQSKRRRKEPATSTAEPANTPSPQAALITSLVPSSAPSPTHVAFYPASAAIAHAHVVERSLLPLPITPTSPVSHLSSPSSSSSSPSTSTSSASSQSVRSTQSIFIAKSDSSSRSHATHRWTELPIELFDRVCSYACSPVYNTLLALSTVSHRWSQLVNGNSTGRLNCWRHVPALRVAPRYADLILSCDPSSHEQLVKIQHWESVLHKLSRIQSLTITLSDTGPHLSRFLDLLLSLVSQFSSAAGADVSSRVRWEQLSVGRSRHHGSNDADWERSCPAFVEFLSRCPPLRSAAVLFTHRLATTANALRQVGGSTRLVHLELEAAALSMMLWADKSWATRPWAGAVAMQSFVLSRLSDMRRRKLPLKALRVALPSLTHLHLVDIGSIDDDAVQHITQHLGDRLTFLRLRVATSLSPSAAVHCSALQCLHLTIDSPTSTVLPASDCLHLMPQLSELTIVDYRRQFAAAVPVVVPPLPNTLTYLHIVCSTGLTVSQQAGDTRPGEPPTAETTIADELPSSLRCLSLTMPHWSISDTFLSSLLTRCPQLTHCHVGESDVRYMNVAWSVGLGQRLMALQSQLGAGVWCRDGREVEKQRLDRRWQREMRITVESY